MKWQSSAFLLYVFSLFFSLFYGDIVLATSPTVHNVDTGLSYASIQEAIDAPETLDGHTIFVEAGIYDENVVVNKSLTLIGEDRETTIIDGGNRARDIVTVKAGNTVVNGFTIRNSDWYWLYDGVYLCAASNSSVCNNEIIDTGCAINVRYSPGSRVFCNNVHNEIEGITVSYSSRSYVFGNNISYSSMQSVSVFRSSGVSVFGNNISHGHLGLLIHDSYSISVSSNNFLQNTAKGIMLDNSNKTIIRQNNITKNWNGIGFLGYSFGNRFYHNNFINNTDQVGLYYMFENMWDDGYPSGGNYWSDYNGTDLYSGPIQNETGGDGIGDTAYIIDENNTDTYPLMVPYTCAHAIAVENVWLGRTALSQGLITQIDVTVINYGRFTETFNLTLYINVTVFGETEVTLASIDATTLTYTWNTTEFAKGNCTIKATTTLVQGETDTTDNNYTCWAIVSMVGDLTGVDGWPDGEVDMRDVGLAAGAFGSYPSHDRWNLDADITGPEYLVPDDNVDMRDVALIARNFGKN